MELAPQKLAVVQNKNSGGNVTLSYTSYGTPTINGELLYSIVIPEHLSSDKWHVHRNSRESSQLRTGFDPPYDDVHSTYHCFQMTVSRLPQANYLGTREKTSDGRLGKYKWVNFSQAAEGRTAIGSGLLEFGLKKGAKVGLCSVNCQEWVLVDLACHAYSMVTVPLYDTLGPEAVDYILGHAEVEAVACSAAKLPAILACLPHQPAVKLVVVYGLDSKTALPPVPGDATFKIITLEDLMDIGYRKPHAHIPPGPQDMALLCYTSGTTGVPKGAMISHSNLIACGANQFAVPCLDLRADDVHISYLPLAHIYERGNLTAGIRAGASIGFFSGDITTLMDDIKELRPTVFASVPRLYNRLYDGVMQAIQSGSAFSRALFHIAYASKHAAIRGGDLSGGRLGPFWDRLVFSTIKAHLGGRVRIMVSGSAPLGTNVMDFLRVCFGSMVIEGYGLTETSSACCGTCPEEFRGGHVGGIAPAVEIKLVDLPDMNYTSADLPHPRGEVCVRGASVFQGYYKDEKNTAEALDDNGWFHTGDVGAWLSGGRLQIIDRKKALFKLAQGEYIAAEKIENIICRSPLISQAFVYGDSLQSRLVAVIVPDVEVVLPWAAKLGLSKDIHELCKSPDVQEAVFRGVVEESKAAELRGFEKVAAITLFAEPFSIQNGLTTPTFKLKRHQAKEKFRKEINDMYNKLSKE